MGKDEFIGVKIGKDGTTSISVWKKGAIWQRKDLRGIDIVGIEGIYTVVEL